MQRCDAFESLDVTLFIYVALYWSLGQSQFPISYSNVNGKLKLPIYLIFYKFHVRNTRNLIEIVRLLLEFATIIPIF